MRILPVTLLFLLLALPARAQEDITAQLPKDAVMAIKIKSCDRVDAIVKDWVPMLKALGLGDEIKNLETMTASSWFFMETGISAEMIDRTKPIYIGATENDQALGLFHPAAGAAWEGKKDLADGAFAVLRSGAVVVGDGAMIESEGRGTPTLFKVDADVALHIYLGDLFEKYRDGIEKEAADAAMGIAAMGEVPEQARALILPVVTAAKDGVLSLEAFDYGAVWTGDRVETEGFVSIREGSGLRNLLKGAGDPGTTDLVGYLPKEAFITASSCMNPTFGVKELKDLLEKAGGSEVAAALLNLASAGNAFSESLTGRSATAVNLNMMSGNMITLYELKPGTDAKKLFDNYDAAKLTESMKKIGIPIAYTFEKAIAKHGEVELHRFGMTSDHPMLGMYLSSMQGCAAAKDNMLILAMSPTGEDDIKVMLDKVTRGEKIADHPHAAAMARLGRGYNLAFTMNIGALKPMAMMFGMVPNMPREVIQAFQNIPDVLTLSTAITFPDGNIRWRGDWPVKEVAKAAEAVMAAMPKETPQEPEGEGGEGDDEDFD